MMSWFVLKNDDGQYYVGNFNRNDGAFVKSVDEWSTNQRYAQRYSNSEGLRRTAFIFKCKIIKLKVKQ